MRNIRRRILVKLLLFHSMSCCRLNVTASCRPPLRTLGHRAADAAELIQEKSRQGPNERPDDEGFAIMDDGTWTARTPWSIIIFLVTPDWTMMCRTCPQGDLSQDVN